jgi:hypothetical protein
LVGQLLLVSLRRWEEVVDFVQVVLLEFTVVIAEVQVAVKMRLGSGQRSLQSSILSI